MSRKKKISIVILSAVGLYAFLFFSPIWFTIDPIVFTPKSEYEIGEEITVYGVSFQTTHMSGCGSFLKIYDAQGNWNSIHHYVCTQNSGFQLPMSFYIEKWDQKLVTDTGHRAQAIPGAYTILLLGKTLSVNIVLPDSDQTNSTRFLDQHGDAILSSIEIKPDDSVQLQVKLSIYSSVNFWFGYKDIINNNAYDQSRRATNELLYAEIYDPNNKLLANLTGEVHLAQSFPVYSSFTFIPVYSPFTFVPETNGNYTAVISNPQSKNILVHYGFGETQKLERLQLLATLED